MYLTSNRLIGKSCILSLNGNLLVSNLGFQFHSLGIRVVMFNQSCEIKFKTGSIGFKMCTYLRVADCARDNTIQTNHRQGVAEFGLRFPLLTTAEVPLDMHGQCVWRTLHRNCLGRRNGWHIWWGLPLATSGYTCWDVSNRLVSYPDLSRASRNETSLEVCVQECMKLNLPKLPHIRN